MTVTVKALIPAKQVETAQATQYTATNCTAYIDKFTVTNNGTANATFSANLVTLNGTPGPANLIVTRGLAPRETYTLPELVGQVLENGTFISTLASAGSTLAMRASGREITG